jgi:hypothetical protein
MIVYCIVFGRQNKNKIENNYEYCNEAINSPLISLLRIKKQ